MVWAVVMVLGTAPWGIFTLLRIRLALAGRLPLRLVRFLRDMHDLEIIRWMLYGPPV